jgi:hypothetical protein
VTLFADHGFLASLGLVFSTLYVLTTARCLQLQHGVWRLSRALEAEAVASVRGRGRASHDDWERLVRDRGELVAMAERAGIVLNSLPALGLVGTSVGIFLGLRAAGAADLAADPGGALRTLMGAGLASSLAANAAGQALAFVLSQVWSGAVAGPYARALSVLDEAVDLVRGGLGAASLRGASE